MIYHYPLINQSDCTIYPKFWVYDVFSLFCLFAQPQNINILLKDSCGGLQIKKLPLIFMKMKVDNFLDYLTL